MPEKTALITGVTGQDGSYLLELLQTKGYDVHGLARSHTVRSLADNGSLRLHIADLTDSEAISRVVQHKGIAMKRLEPPAQVEHMPPFHVSSEERRR